MTETKVVVTAQDVKKLRDMTAAGMADCKNALIEAAGDFEQAIVVLRKRGMKISAARQENELKHGAAVTLIASDYRTGAALLLACETDFVAINEDFIALAEAFVKIALDQKIKTADDLMAVSMGNLTIGEKITEFMGRVGENIRVVGLSLLEGDYVHSYVHRSGEERKVATLIALKVGKEAINDSDKELAHKVAMQVASMKPLVAQREQVAAEIVERELQVIQDKLSKENKPQNIIDSMKKGMMDKFYKEVCLVEQPYLFDDKQNVAAILSRYDLECIELARLAVS